jgi:hypothetical protein
MKVQVRVQSTSEVLWDSNDTRMSSSVSDSLKRGGPRKRILSSPS